MGLHRVRHDLSDWACMHACLEEGNDKTLQYSCLENPKDRGAWWAAVSGVTKSRTWQKQLSSISDSSSSSSEVISTILSSGLLNHPSVSDILALIPHTAFLISAIVLFVSVCLFFKSSRSLLTHSCIFSILFSRFLVIFTIIILNSFSGSLCICFSFI